MKNFSAKEAESDERILEIARATDEFESYMNPHAARLAILADAVAKRFHLAAQDRYVLRQAALVHDIGASVMDREYIKSNRQLREDERVDMQRHTIIGEQEAAKRGLPRAVQLLVRWHHEWFCGAGYPDALEGEQIPLAARILRVADTFSALTNARPFRAAFSDAEAQKYLTEWAGIEFDPKIVRAFLSLEEIKETESYSEINVAPPEINVVENAPQSISIFAQFLNFMFAQSNNSPQSWLAFELNVLRRLNFESAMLPFTDQPYLGAYLKRWNARVLANDVSLTGWTKAVAAIENNSEKLSETDINLVLEDAYTPSYRLQNTALRHWFNETDAWWFDNVRRNCERLESPIRRAIALSLALSVGDYARSFTEENLDLRQPLSTVFRRLSSIQPVPVNNGQKNTCQNKPVDEFIAGSYTDLMFLRLPAAHKQTQKNRFGTAAWREEWLRGNSDFWNDFETAQAGRLGTLIETKSQYLRLVEETLRAASEIPKWIVAHVEDGFISTQEIVETIGHVRRVDTIFTKDFSELTGAKAVIITA